MAGWLAAGCWLLRKEAGRQAGCVVSVVVAVVFAGGGRRAAGGKAARTALRAATRAHPPVACLPSKPAA